MLSLESDTQSRTTDGPVRLPTIVPRDDGAAEVVRRAIDVAVAATMLVLLSPLIVVAAVLVRATSRGPAVFRQVRLGQGGRPFVFYKFRGMYVDARERWPELYEYRYEADELQTLRFHPENDPRVTPVGRFLRRTSIDEILNFYNVLKGDMSIVGPRPEIPEMIPYYGEHAAAGPARPVPLPPVRGSRWSAAGERSRMRRRRRAAAPRSRPSGTRERRR